MPLASIPPSASERILDQLESAEWHESNPHFQDDYRIAWITTLRAARGEIIPHVSATYSVLGLHPDKVWAAMIERRKLLLGAEFEGFQKATSLAESSSPKKPMQSVRTSVRREPAA